LSVCKIAKVII